MALYGEFTNVDAELQGDDLRKVYQYPYSVYAPDLYFRQVGFGFVARPFDAGDDIFSVLGGQSGNVLAAGLMDYDGIRAGSSVSYDIVARNGITPFRDDEFDALQM